MKKEGRTPYLRQWWFLDYIFSILLVAFIHGKGEQRQLADL
jgi:hypothetical protein